MLTSSTVAAWGNDRAPDLEGMQMHNMAACLQSLDDHHRVETYAGTEWNEKKKISIDASTTTLGTIITVALQLDDVAPPSFVAPPPPKTLASNSTSRYRRCHLSSGVVLTGAWSETLLSIQWRFPARQTHKWRCSRRLAGWDGYQKHLPEATLLLFF